MILSPKARVFDDDVVSIVAPGEAGYLGVLANHAPLVSTMKEGHLKITSPSGAEKWYRIGGGILRVAHNSAVLLTEFIEETGVPNQG